MLSERFAAAEKELFELQQGERKLDSIFEKERPLTLDECFDRELIRLAKEFKSGYYDKILALRKQVDESVYLDDIDEKWLSNMVNSLTKMGNINNTIKKKIKVIRGIISDYSKKGVRKEIKEYNVPTTKSIKQKLTAKELEKLETMVLPDGSLLETCRNIFLLQVYLRGIRIGDILQAKSTDFVNGRFNYRSDKTDEPYNIKLIPKAQAIVDLYNGKYERLFPLFKWSPDKRLTKFENMRE